MDLKWRDKVLDSELKIVGKNRVEGFRRSSSWAKDQVVYFVAEFSKDFQPKAMEFDTEKENVKGLVLLQDGKASLSNKNGIKVNFQYNTSTNEKSLSKSESLLFQSKMPVKISKLKFPIGILKKFAKTRKPLGIKNLAKSKLLMITKKI